MNFSEIKEIVALINQSNLTEFHVKDQQFELYLNKNAQAQKTMSEAPVSAPVQAPAPVVTPTATSTATPEAAPVVEAATEVEDTTGKEITSPLVGVAYLKPSPDKANFKQVGDTVKKGDVLCILEAMKVMNEIVSDVDGTISAILIENEAVVEYGQPLFRVREG
ncbi:acetyl-CoA carboxylase biotin carboxyl carrier protein [uncultured Enterococcus sp.]|uniref:acetyl-CoA carboxylase biotin carboxyl carrier protein n=1 Tax=uncultured Enterococcus sp. TaxID=167972 RepID=UPI0025F7C897|nr:acetyl-CoA carboxylase biotin carboxyl carrier protein [uncultured Enterococcus sp.]